MCFQVDFKSDLKKVLYEKVLEVKVSEICLVRLFNLKI